MRQLRRNLFVGILGLAIVTGLSMHLAGCGSETSNTVSEDQISARPVKIALAQSVVNNSVKTFPGVTEAARKSTLAFRVDGLVQKLPVKAGQSLKKGDLIASLDETPYRNLVDDRKAKYDLAKAKFERKKILYLKKLVAKASYDEHVANLKAAEVALQLAREDLKHTSLLTPYDGIVAKVYIDNYQNVQDKEQVIEFQGEKNIDIVFNVPEHLLLEGRREKAEKLPFQVKFNARPDLTFTAYYRKHDSIPDPTTRSYRVVLSMPLPKDMRVLPGMSITVSVMPPQTGNSKADSAVLVPIEALFEEGGQSFVWSVDDNYIARKTLVTAGSIEGTSVRIVSGLTPKQKVIAAGVSRITEGLKVTQLKKERGL